MRAKKQAIDPCGLRGCDRLRDYQPFCLQGSQRFFFDTGTMIESRSSGCGPYTKSARVWRPLHSGFSVVAKTEVIWLNIRPIYNKSTRTQIQNNARVSHLLHRPHIMSPPWPLAVWLTPKSSLLTFILGVITIALVIRLRWNRVSLPPSPSGLPVLGHLHLMFVSVFHTFSILIDSDALTHTGHQSDPGYGLANLHGACTPRSSISTWVDRTL